MPTYSRVFGANLTGFTAIRLIDVNVIDTIKATSPFTLFTAGNPIQLKSLGLAELDSIHSFKQLNGTGELMYDSKLTDSGLLHSYEIAFEQPKNQYELAAFVKTANYSKFVAVVADGNNKFMIIGTKTHPVLIETSMDLNPNSYTIKASCQTTAQPIFVLGFNFGSLFGATYNAYY